MRLHLSIRAELAGGRLAISGLEIEGVTGLVGPSGVGKTTVLEYVAGLRRPDSGRISCGDEVWFSSEDGIETAPGSRRVGYVPQDLALFPHLSARQNVAWGAEGSRVERAQRADEILEQFRLSDLADRRASRLSGGERRRVALGRALARRPAALLLDEPFTGLDASARNDAISVVRAVCEQTGVPTLLVSHDFVDVARISGRVAVIEAGAITQVGPAAELANAPKTPFVAALVGRGAPDRDSAEAGSGRCS